MRLQAVKALNIVAAGLWLAGCSVTSDVGSMFSGKRGSDEARATMPPPAMTSSPMTPPPMTETTGSIAPRHNAGAPAADEAPPKPPAPIIAAAPVLPGTDGKDDVSRGRAQFRAGNFAEAEVSFDRAAKMNPRDAEAWLGLAACYDRMRRFELADRAYVQASAINGPTAEILNNQGFSYFLRGDLARARTTLSVAQKKDPSNKFVQNNLRMLEQKERSAKAQ
jgi:tetratricopeptide (TPR) repeat protein